MARSTFFYLLELLPLFYKGNSIALEPRGQVHIYGLTIKRHTHVRGEKEKHILGKFVVFYPGCVAEKVFATRPEPKLFLCSSPSPFRAIPYGPLRGDEGAKMSQYNIARGAAWDTRSLPFAPESRNDDDWGGWDDCPTPPLKTYAFITWCYRQKQHKPDVVVVGSDQTKTRQNKEENRAPKTEVGDTGEKRQVAPPEIGLNL